jgi:HSP20 family protein
MATPTEETKRNLMLREPFAALQGLEDEIEDWFRSPRWFGRSFRFPRLPRLESGAAWAPSVDIYEDGNELVVKAELPGVTKEDVTVSLEEDTLVLQGERKSEKEVKEDKYYRMERQYGSFYRRLPVPAGTTEDSIKASFKDGILEIRMPKPAESKPAAKQITVA